MPAAASDAAPAGRAAPGGPERAALRRFRRHGAAVVSLAVLLLLAALVAAAPLVAAALGLERDAIDFFAMAAPPSPAHPLGTDQLGRDLLVRLLYGGRVSLTVALATALVAAVLGTMVGLVAGFRGGWIDALLMRLTDGVIALPLLPLLIVLAAIDLEKVLPEAMAESESAQLYRIVAIIALVGWTTVARLVRGATLAVRQQDFVKAATALGAGSRRLMLVHILPNVASPIVVATTLSVGQIILLESTLSFLGLGIQPPTPSWGNMLTNAQELIWSAPHLAVFPGLLIFVTVIAFNFVGDGLQDALDPRSGIGRRR